jgi:hypothetical protein
MPIHPSYKKLVLPKDNAKEAKQISSIKLTSLLRDNPLTNSSSSLVSVKSIVRYLEVAPYKKIIEGKKVNFA